MRFWINSTPFEYSYVPVFDDFAAATKVQLALNNELAPKHPGKVSVATSIRKAARLVRRAWVQAKNER